MMELSVVCRRWKRGNRTAMAREDTRVQVVRYLHMEEVNKVVIKEITGDVLKEILGRLHCWSSS